MLIFKIWNLHWSGIGKCFAEFSFDDILGGEIELLKHLWAHGDALGRSEAVERLHSVLAVVVFSIEGLIGHVIAFGVCHCVGSGEAGERFFLGLEAVDSLDCSSSCRLLPKGCVFGSRWLQLFL